MPLIGGGSQEKHVFQVVLHGMGDEERAFQTSLPDSAMKKTLRDHLLVPFVQQCKQHKGATYACSYIEVNGHQVESEEELCLPLRDYLVPGADPKLYQQITDTTQLLSVIQEYLEDYNSVSNAPMNLVMFLDACDHVCRISRII